LFENYLIILTQMLFSIKLWQENKKIDANGFVGNHIKIDTFETKLIVVIFNIFFCSNNVVADFDLQKALLLSKCKKNRTLKNSIGLVRALIYQLSYKNVG